MPDAPYILIPLRSRDGIARAHAVIDAEDEHLAAHCWSLNSHGYAQRSLPRSATGRPVISLHRAVLGLVPGDGLQADHIDRDRLNCRRANLRTVTNAQNGQNCVFKPGSSSCYRGVSWNTRHRKWHAAAKLNGADHYLGYFDDENEAAAVVQAWRLANMPFAVEPALPLSPAPATM